MNRPRRAKSKRRLLPLPLDESETKCGICLDDVIKRGKIGPCSHLYCYSCLLEWSKQNNSCPQCKSIFRCITKIDLATNDFEEKVFIKDTTLRSGHTGSSDEEYEYVDSEELDDSEPDFIDHSEVANHYSDDEPEAQFTQRPTQRPTERPSQRPTPTQRSKRKRARISRILSESESDLSDPDNKENTAIHENIIRNCKSPDLFEDTSPKPSSSNSKQSKKFNCPFKSFSSNGVSHSPKRTRSSMVTMATRSSSNLPPLKRSSRWVALNQAVQSLKRKRSMKSKRIGIPIKTLSPGRLIIRSPADKADKAKSPVGCKSSQTNSSQWLSTRSSSFSSHHVKRTPTKSSVNSQFKLPFVKEKTVKRLYEDPEDYFTKLIEEDQD